MIKELAQFTENLDDDLKNRGIKPREGLHILLKMKEESGEWQLDLENIEYERYTKKMNHETVFLEKCAFLSQSAWCIDTNKCFDLPMKAIHSCSPFCVAFKYEHLENGTKYEANKNKDKKQIYERFGDYFAKSLDLFEKEEDKQKYKVYKAFFTQKESEGYFERILKNIERDFIQQRKKLENQTNELKKLQDETSDQEEKKLFKVQIDDLSKQFEPIKELSDSDYIIFYLDEPLKKYEEVHQKYLADKLFNTAYYNTEPNEEGDIFGTSNFFNGFNSSMPFLLHQTATFDITNRISDKEAKYLYEFQQLLPRKTLPNPLPIFIFEEELQKKVIGLFKDSGFKLGYKEIIENLWDDYKYEFGNYYLLFYQNTKDGLVFKDFDFVSKFEYELKDEEGKAWKVEDLFDVNFGFKIQNVFDFQNKILQVVFNNNLIVKAKNDIWIYKYFDEIDVQYSKSTRNYLIIMNYRKAFYDFIYKSQRQSVNKNTFDDIMMVSILEDIRLDEFKNNSHSEYLNIRKKLNIWFSLYEKFDSHLNHEKSMASKLKEYQQFVADLAEERANPDEATTEQFAFAAGQVIYYILKKSKSADQSYQRLERYLQQAKFSGLNEVITTEFARYKHENYSKRFERVASFVLTFEINENVKKYLPQIIAGIFAQPQLYSERQDQEIIESEKE